MKLPTVLLVLLVAATFASGCMAKKTETTTTPTPPSTPATTTSSSPSTSSPAPTTTAPMAPAQVLKNVFKYAAANDPAKSFNVATGTVRLDVTVYVNATGSPYSVAAASGQGNPYVEIKDPAGASTKIEWTGASGTLIGSTSTVIAGPLSKAITPAAAGAWTASISGTGNNVQADVKVVATFA